MEEIIKPNRRESLSNNYTLKQLRHVLDNYKPKNKVKGCLNGNFKDGNGEKYIRLRIDGVKVRLSHIVFRLNTREKIKMGYNIHHKDENKRNNNSNNLEMVKARPHGNLNLKNQNGQFTYKPIVIPNKLNDNYIKEIDLR